MIFAPFTKITRKGDAKNEGSTQIARNPTLATSEGASMERVLGIGGMFFRAKDHKALATWYEQHLGINKVPKGPDDTPWTQEAGPTAFSPFSQTSSYFGRDEQQWMLNFRVRDIDAMVAQLRAAGLEVPDPEEYPPLGRFTRVHDPEGNPIELWQPA